MNRRDFLKRSTAAVAAAGTMGSAAAAPKPPKPEEERRSAPPPSHGPRILPQPDAIALYIDPALSYTSRGGLKTTGWLMEPMACAVRRAISATAGYVPWRAELRFDTPPESWRMVGLCKERVLIVHQESYIFPVRGAGGRFEPRERLVTMTGEGVVSVVAWETDKGPIRLTVESTGPLSYQETAVEERQQQF